MSDYIYRQILYFCQTSYSLTTFKLAVFAAWLKLAPTCKNGSVMYCSRYCCYQLLVSLNKHQKGGETVLNARDLMSFTDIHTAAHFSEGVECVTVLKTCTTLMNPNEDFSGFQLALIPLFVVLIAFFNICAEEMHTLMLGCFNPNMCKIWTNSTAEWN